MLELDLLIFLWEFEYIFDGIVHGSELQFEQFLVKETFPEAEISTLWDNKYQLFYDYKRIFKNGPKPPVNGA
jgi:hypothetical protein